MFLYSALLNTLYMASVHNLTVGHCNIQGGLIGISKSTQILDMIKKYNMDILSLNHSQNLTVASARNWRVCRQGRRGQGSRRQGRGRHGRTGQGRGT